MKQCRVNSYNPRLNKFHTIDEIFESKNPEKTNRVLTGKGLYLISVTY